MQAESDTHGQNLRFIPISAMVAAKIRMVHPIMSKQTERSAQKPALSNALRANMQRRKAVGAKAGTHRPKKTDALKVDSLNGGK